LMRLKEWSRTFEGLEGTRLVWEDETTLCQSVARGILR
jgi:hypothetical protein